MAKQESFGTLNGQWITRATDITDCLIGEGFNYLHYDVKKALNPDEVSLRTKLVLGLRVEVPKSERSKATKNIVDAIEKKYITGSSPRQKYEVTLKGKDPNNQTKYNNAIDIEIKVGNKEKTFRIDVKPNDQGGSGGGSASTAVNECMFAVYAALRTHVYSKDIDPELGIDEKHLEQAYKHCKLDKKLKDLWADGVWHNSHAIGANILYKKVISKFPGNGSSAEFWRGLGGDDKEIKKAYGRLNNNLKTLDGVTPFTSEDKWNPADIWVADKSFDITPLNDKNDAGSINKFFAEAYDSNKLVGVSLKKMGATANFKVMNGETPSERKEKVKDMLWADENKKGGYDLFFENRGNTPIDAYLYYGSGDYDKFQLRNFGGKKASWQIELKGATAAHGRCGGGQVAQLVNAYNKGSFPWSNDSLYSQCSKTSGDKLKITNEIVDLLIDFDAKNIKKGIDVKKDRDQYVGLVANKPQEWRYSKLNGLRLLKALRDSAKKGVADDIVQALYLFASSQLDFSSIFVKVY
tara:strand:- start:3161 stop:4726 length:1566 start_codon:yes stop_codon:yes gene_type:complete